MSKPHNNYALDPKPLGIGGYADVFKARDKRTNQIVALKRLKNHFDDHVARMRREIEVQSAVKHRNVMPVFDHSESFYWYTMPVAEKILGKLPTPIDDETLFQVIEDCANGLIDAHKEGYIHRDLSPNNLLYIIDNDDPRWVVADWGLVRRHGQTTVIRTAPGQSFGTFGFAPPEMWVDAHSVGKCGDVYSLGRVIAWCLTGIWPSPNVPLLPEGNWREFVRLTTILDSEQRIQDMNGVLELLGNIKTQIYTDNKEPMNISNIVSLPGLTKVDTVVFKTICDISLEGSGDWVGINQLSNVLEQLDISEEELSESIEILAANNYIQGTPTLNKSLEFFQITTFGFLQYAIQFLPDFNNLVERVLLAIVNSNLRENNTISKYLEQSIILIDYILDILARRNLIKISKFIGGDISVNDVTAQGRRTARSVIYDG